MILEKLFMSSYREIAQEAIFLIRICNINDCGTHNLYMRL